MAHETLINPGGDPPDERLRLENDILRMKLRAEFGTDLRLTSDLSPRVQHAVLQHVYRLEAITRMKGSKISIYQKIGSPPFIPVEELSDLRVVIELERLMKWLRQHHIMLEVLAEYDPKTIYRFITKELFLLEIDDFPEKGWYIHFCYEQFHPNDDHALRKYTTLFIEDIMSKDVHEQFNPLYHEMLDRQDEIITGNEAYHRIQQFSENFSSFSLRSLQLNAVNFDEAEGLVQFSISFVGVLDNGECMNMEGEGEFHFIRLPSGGWSIRRFRMPGLHI